MRGRYKNLPQRFYDGCHFWQQRYFLHLMPRTAVPVMARPAESTIILPYLQYSQHPDLLRTLLHIFLNQDRDTYMLLPISNIQIRDIHLFLLHTNIPYYFSSLANFSNPCTIYSCLLKTLTGTSAPASARCLIILSRSLCSVR